MPEPHDTTGHSELDSPSRLSSYLGSRPILWLVLAAIAGAAAVLAALWVNARTLRLGGSFRDVPVAIEMARSAEDLARQPPPATQRPKNIILFVGDGLGFSHLSAARAARLR